MDSAEKRLTVKEQKLVTKCKGLLLSNLPMEPPGLIDNNSENDFWWCNERCQEEEENLGKNNDTDEFVKWIELPNAYIKDGRRRTMTGWTLWFLCSSLNFDTFLKLVLLFKVLNYKWECFSKIRQFLLKYSVTDRSFGPNLAVLFKI